MRKLIFVWCIVPFIAAGQTKNVISSDRYFPKSDKIEEFEKALSAHAKKFHTGDYSWRVFDILSGPEAGGYMIVEGPGSWEDLDKRGNISPEHNTDFVKNVAPLTTGNSSLFGIFRSDLSTVQIGDYAEKIAVTHVFIKPGLGGDVETLFKKIKKAWEAGQQSVAVYESSASGPQQYLVVNRYPQGWKERDTSFRKSFRERYNTVNGEDSFDNYLEVIQKCVEKSWSEMLVMRKDLGSAE